MPSPSVSTPPPLVALDVVGCGCAEGEDCSCPADGGGCMNGFCFCTDGRLEYEERRCHPAYEHSDVLTSSCPLSCRCGCRESEQCGADGRCYCPDGSLVVPLVDADDRLAGRNQTCPQVMGRFCSITYLGTTHHPY